MDPVTNYCRAILGDDGEAMNAIRLIPEFSGCSDRLLEMVYQYSKTVDMEPGETLITEGLFDQWVYFIIRGDLNVVINGKKLGSTAGPIVGERCILGEPRGADLAAGDDGVLALGVEMTIIDELVREINNFRKTTDDQERIEKYEEDKMSVALELLIIVLSEVVGRIIGLYEAGQRSANQLEKSSNTVKKVQLQSLYDFSDNEYRKGESSSEEVPQEDASQKIPVYSFDDFSEIVYFEILQKYLSDHGFLEFPLERWKETFVVGESSQVRIAETYAWLKSEYGLSNTELLDVTYSIFEVASKYTAAGNKAVSQILSAFEDADEKQKAMDSMESSDDADDGRNVAELKEKLFAPVQRKLQDSQSVTDGSATAKLNQSDIDSFFD
ncbi:MAG: hypothetical protein GY866_04165 [Proteobacteria bacterium]|nr:hypothetical protein [Pseudomonadota bacterium]